MKKYVLFKSKRAKSWAGAIPVKKGVRSDALRRVLARFVKKGFNTRIASKSQVMKLRKR